MKLSDLKQGESAIIHKLSNNDELNTRLYSFGIAPGAKLQVEMFSLGNNNISIMVNQTLIGLRITEASSIDVTKK